MSSTLSTISINTVQAHPDIFHPTYDITHPNSTAINGTTVHVMSTCKASLQFQHDVTKALYTSIIPFRIINTHPNKQGDCITLSYMASIKHFYEIYLQNHATYRSMILSNFRDMTSNITSGNVNRILTKHLSYHQNGTIQPTNQPPTLLTPSPLVTSKLDLYCLQCAVPSPPPPQIPPPSFIYTPPTTLHNLLAPITLVPPETEQDQGDMLLSEDPQENLQKWPRRTCKSGWLRFTADATCTGERDTCTLKHAGCSLVTNCHSNIS